jgi:NDP-sugar pyrophosphorylase family protein
MRFEEKNATRSAPSWINAGVYLFDRTILAGIAKLSYGSLERDVLEVMLPGSIHAYQTEGRFLDIGTPESLDQAATFFKHRITSEDSKA